MLSRSQTVSRSTGRPRRPLRRVPFFFPGISVYPALPGRNLFFLSVRPRTLFRGGFVCLPAPGMIYPCLFPCLFILSLFMAIHPFVTRYSVAGDGAVSGLIYQGSFLWIGLVTYVRAAAGDPPLAINPRRWPICFPFRLGSMSTPFHATGAGRRGLLRFPGARPCFLRQWRVWH